jgi:hypothetical protein
MRGPGGPGGRGEGRHGGKGGPMGHALHGEFVVRNGTDAYRTIAVQTGTVTAISKTSITVKSADNFSKTYAVSENTLVNAGRDGIDNVKEGNEVRVRAVVEGGTANAMSIDDATTTKAIRDHWAPPPPASTTQSQQSSTSMT